MRFDKALRESIHFSAWRLQHVPAVTPDPAPAPADSPRCRPRCAVFSQPREPRTSRTTARPDEDGVPAERDEALAGMDMQPTAEPEIIFKDVVD